ncbi:MAG: helix-turn-helix domain-containing protein [Nitrospirota bacterium]
MIKLSYLKALEDEDFKALPCEVFTKGYIRVYLEFLNMDSTEGLRILQEDGFYPVKSQVKLNTSKYASSVKIDTGGTEQPSKQPANLSQTYSALENSTPDYTRHLVYLIVFLVFLAVVVYSSSKLFSAAKEGSTAVTSSVGSSDNQALRNGKSSDLQPDSAKNSEKTPVTVEKKAVSKLPDAKKTSKKPSDKIKESMNILNMSTAEASTQTQPQAPVINKPELKDVSKSVQKMKAMTASLKSLKTAVEKAKSAGQKPPLDASKSESPSVVPMPAEVQPTDVPVQTPVQINEKPDTKHMTTTPTALASEKELNRTVAAGAETFSYSRESGGSSDGGSVGAVDVLNMQPPEAEKPELTVTGDTY